MWGSNIDEDENTEKLTVSIRGKRCAKYVGRPNVFLRQFFVALILHAAYGLYKCANLCVFMMTLYAAVLHSILRFLYSITDMFGRQSFLGENKSIFFW